MKRSDYESTGFCFAAWPTWTMVWTHTTHLRPSCIARKQARIVDACWQTWDRSNIESAHHACEGSAPHLLTVSAALIAPCPEKACPGHAPLLISKPTRCGCCADSVPHSLLYPRHRQRPSASALRSARHCQSDKRLECLLRVATTQTAYGLPSVSESMPSLRQTARAIDRCEFRRRPPVKSGYSQVSRCPL